MWGTDQPWKCDPPWEPPGMSVPSISCARQLRVHPASAVPTVRNSTPKFLHHQSTAIHIFASRKASSNHLWWWFANWLFTVHEFYLLLLTTTIYNLHIHQLQDTFRTAIMIWKWIYEGKQTQMQRCVNTCANEFKKTIMLHSFESSTSN